MSLPVWRIVSMTTSRLTMCRPSPHRAMRAALIALTAAIALRSMHGTCTRPATGSQVSPSECSIAISAAFSTCCGVPPRACASPAAAIAEADPTSPWQPTSAPAMDAFVLMSAPIAVAARRNSCTRARRRAAHSSTDEAGASSPGSAPSSGAGAEAGGVIRMWHSGARAPSCVAGPAATPGAEPVSGQCVTR